MAPWDIHPLTSASIHSKPTLPLSHSLPPCLLTRIHTHARTHRHSTQTNYYAPNRRGERGGSVVECRTPEREVRGSKPTAAVLCPWARHFTPRKYWLITQEAMAPSRYDWKIVDWDVKPQHNQPTNPNRRVGGHIAFGADPVGVGVRLSVW